MTKRNLLLLTYLLIIFSCNKKENKTISNSVLTDKNYRVISRTDGNGNTFAYQYEKNKYKSIYRKMQNEDSSLLLCKWDYNDNYVLISYFTDSAKWFYEGFRYPKRSLSGNNKQGFFEYNKEEYLIKSEFIDSFYNIREVNLYTYIDSNIVSSEKIFTNLQGEKIHSAKYNYTYYENYNSLKELGNPILNEHFYLFNYSNKLLKSIQSGDYPDYIYKYTFDKNSLPISRVNIVDSKIDQYYFEEY
ncbi:MAG: hypothetical protein JHD28_10310 [Bacteroidia bacterium]|nr:hypothetical protein [Bacteroidia bacterium]